MFGFIKFIFTIGLILTIWYGYTFFSKLDSKQKLALKEHTIQAIESEKVELIASPLSEMVKEDISHKKEQFWDKIKHKIKDVIFN